MTKKSINIGFAVNNLKPISDYDTATDIADFLTDANDFLKYFQKSIELFIQDIRIKQKKHGEEWIDYKSDELIHGLSEFIKHYNRDEGLRFKLKRLTSNRYVVIKNDVCALEIIARRVDRIVTRTNNTIGLFVANYFRAKDFDSLLGMMNALSEDIQVNLEGMIAICNLTKEIISKYDD